MLGFQTFIIFPLKQLKDLGPWDVHGRAGEIPRRVLVAVEHVSKFSRQKFEDEVGVCLSVGGVDGL